MSLREFEDESGNRWRVWDTLPMQFEGLGTFRGGWLTFDNGSERRRISPVPENWVELPDERLSLLVRVAQSALPRVQRAERPQIERREAERRERDRRERDRRRADS